MLRIPTKYTADKKAEAIIEKYLNDVIIELAESALETASDGKTPIEKDPMVKEHLAIYFPKACTEAMRIPVMKDLLWLLKDDKEHVPMLVMEYVIAKLFDVHIEVMEDADYPLNIPLSTDREYVVAVLKKDYPVATEMDPAWDDLIKEIEDLQEYETKYFWDTDFLWLNQYPGKIRLKDYKISKEDWFSVQEN